MPDDNDFMPSVHAEHDALLRLPTLKNKKKLESINLLVIRVSVKNKLQGSKPCNDCIQKMRYIPESKGYKLKYIYYSNNAGQIVETNLANLENEPQHYTRYYKNMRLKLNNNNNK
jgi:hypothetical protein